MGQPEHTPKKYSMHFIWVNSADNPTQTIMVHMFSNAWSHPVSLLVQSSWNPSCCWGRASRSSQEPRANGLEWASVPWGPGRQPGSTNREQELHASSLIVELVSAGKPAASPAFQMEMGMLKIVDNEGYMKIKLNKHYLHYNCDLFWLTFFCEKHFRVFLFLHEVKKLIMEEDDEGKSTLEQLALTSKYTTTYSSHEGKIQSFLLNYYSLHFYVNLFKILPFCKLK